ncbi:MAG: tRNA (adenosine(37)-N6)-dimethylallyltransferase MiaA [Sphingobacterium sp.]
MDEIRHLTSQKDIVAYINRAKENQNLSPDFLLVILGPTASGKTKLATNLARNYHGEIISADSRQIYRGLNIGTGKDLNEYEGIPYHLIDIKNPTDHYSVNQFRTDFSVAYQRIRSKGRQAILCGGTGSYIQAILQDQPFSRIPSDDVYHARLAEYTMDELTAMVQRENVPADFSIDIKNKKRVIRALEILEYLRKNPLPPPATLSVKEYLIIGLNPGLQERRSLIDERLVKRLDEGLIGEIDHLLTAGLTHQQIQWFGLEYKYASYYLSGRMNKLEFIEKLRTEIHRFAKRQMTYFRKMEKDGLAIHWFRSV